MSTKYPGGIISKTAPTPSGPYSTDTAPGIWTLEQQAYWQKLGQWPTAGNINPNAFIENLFSTYLYTGNGSTQTITNGIDLSTKGGLVWIKNRGGYSHALFDTSRGVENLIKSNTTEAQSALSGSLTSFTSSGFSLGSAGIVNDGSGTYPNNVSWTFRKQPKFFDVVTYTGDDTAGRNISHNLGSVPGCIIVKNLTNGSANWYVYHQSLGNATRIFLNLTDASSASTNWNSTTPTSTVFTVGNGVGVNASGNDYVAYLFAHNAGGFGLSGSENVISCGSYTGSNSSDVTVNLGYEPQWVMIKRTDSSGSPAWWIGDTMRGLDMQGIKRLEANTSGAEYGYYNGINPTSTGFVLPYGTVLNDAATSTYIYIAIRRGPMAVPTLGTSVFSPNISSGSTGTVITTNFPVDMQINSPRDIAFDKTVVDRLRGVITTPTDTLATRLRTNLTNAEGDNFYSRGWNNTGFQMPSTIADTSDVFWSFRRAPSFFDEVCYTGTGYSVSQTLTHNLSVTPELMIAKDRSTGGAWGVYSVTLGATKYLQLNEAFAEDTSQYYWGNTAPTSTQFTVKGGTNIVGDTYVAYLFATCAGVSKVGSYTGTGTTKQIDCGFTGGARFVLIKRTDSTGDWYIWDSARGIVAGNDPYLLLNSTAAEVTGTDYVDTYSAGFEISSTAPSAINASGGTFIFLAIA